jgi:hypothetical protein
MEGELKLRGWTGVKNAGSFAYRESFIVGERKKNYFKNKKTN